MIPEKIWQEIRREATDASRAEPVLASFYHACILNHHTLADAVSFHLANLLGSQIVPAMQIREVFTRAMQQDASILQALCRDIEAWCERDPACDQYLLPLLYFKGFHALQSYRFSHYLWQQQRRVMALYLQNRISEMFAVDIHPAARIGAGIMIDHATGVVIGETAVVGDDVSMLHAVTLGGSGKSSGDRHPKVGKGVLISAGAKILGNIHIGDYARIGAGSVVLADIAAHQTAVGVPARVTGRTGTDKPASEMNHCIDEDRADGQ
ncbi:MAG TPA: serine O-acetyltransferase [Cellvibrionaceae bacterium]